MRDVDGRKAGLASFTHARLKPWFKPRLKPGWSKPQKPTHLWAKPQNPATLVKTWLNMNKSVLFIHVM